jgi:hypothetical protein
MPAKKVNLKTMSFYIPSINVRQFQRYSCIKLKCCLVVIFLFHKVIVNFESLQIHQLPQAKLMRFLCPTLAKY